MALQLFALFLLACNHLADMGMFIDNTNVTDINDLKEMKAFAKGLAIGFKTEDKDVIMGIIANGRRSHILDIHRKSRLEKNGRNHIKHPKNRHTNQARDFISRLKSRLANRAKNPIAHTKSKLVRHTENGHNSQGFKRAEAYMLAKQKVPLPPILNDVLFVLVSGAESDVEVHAPIKDVKAAGAKIVVIGVGKDAKLGNVASQADDVFMVPPGAGNAIVNAIVVAVCKKCKCLSLTGGGGESTVRDV